MSLIKIRKVSVLDSWRWLTDLWGISKDGYRFILPLLLLMFSLSFISPDIDFVERGYLTVVDLINTFLYPFIPVLLTGLLLTKALGFNKSALSVVFNLKIIFHSLISAGLIVLSIILFLNLNPEIERLSDAAFDKISLVSFDEKTATSEDLVRVRAIEKEYIDSIAEVQGVQHRILISVISIFFPLMLFIFYTLLVSLPLAISTELGILRAYWLSIKNIAINPVSVIILIISLLIIIISLEFILSLLGESYGDIIYPCMLTIGCLISVAFTKNMITVERKA